MAAIPLTDDLRQQYQQMFDTCTVRPEHQNEVTATTEKIAANQQRYETAGKPLGIPWYVVGVIHCLEGSLSFKTHLHNGDPLTARTVHVPKGRPAAGQPPFTWEVSATDALTFDGFDKVKDWSLPSALYNIEKYNGQGYRRLAKPISSPYLWSFSTFYDKGKFGSDGKYDPELVSKQCGAAVLLRALVDSGAVTLGA